MNDSKPLSALYLLGGAGLILGCAATGMANGTEAHAGHFSLGSLIVPLGIATLVLIILTVLLGVFRRAKPRGMLRWHKITGILALVCGLCHALVIFLAH